MLDAHKHLWMDSTAPSRSKITISEDSKPRSTCLHALALVGNHALLLQQEQHFYLLSLSRLQRLKLELNLTLTATSQPLLIPVIFRLSETQWQAWQQQKAWFTQVGFDFLTEDAQRKITLQKVSAYLRRQNLQQLIIALLNEPVENLSEFLTALLAQLDFPPIQVLADAVTMLTETEQLLNKQSHIRLSDLFLEINWQPYLTQLAD